MSGKFFENQVDSAGPRGHDLPVPEPALRFVELPALALAALIAGDLPTASAETGIELPEEFTDPDAQWLWQLRYGQIQAKPGDAPWIARAVLVNDEVVGYAGYHGPPDENGMVEIGYTVLPRHRRRGHARAMLRALIQRGIDEPAVRTVRVTISPDNIASLATIARERFVYVGEQHDEEDGRELIFELPAR